MSMLSAFSVSASFPFQEGVRQGGFVFEQIKSTATDNGYQFVNVFFRAQVL